MSQPDARSLYRCRICPRLFAPCEVASDDVAPCGHFWTTPGGDQVEYPRRAELRHFRRRHRLVLLAWLRRADVEWIDLIRNTARMEPRPARRETALGRVRTAEEIAYRALCEVYGPRVVLRWLRRQAKVLRVCPDCGGVLKASLVLCRRGRSHCGCLQPSSPPRPTLILIPRADRQTGVAA